MTAANYSNQIDLLSRSVNINPVDLNMLDTNVDVDHNLESNQ